MRLRLKFTLFAILASTFAIHSQVAKRVVSLAPSITKNIYLMGAQDKLVGCTSYCITEKEDNVPVVASAVKVNIERLYSLKPDMVLTAGLTSPETLGMLKKLGIKYKVFESPKDFEGICYQFLEIAKVVGYEENANKIITVEKAKLAKLSSKIPKTKAPEIFIELGAKPLFAVIPNTFMHDYIKYVGGINIATDMNTGIISRETVLLKNPDIIFITTMGATGDEEINTWLNYKGLNAAKTNSVFTLDSDIACTPCPTSFTETVAKMIELMYGK
ncbi:MAG: helical backbone metal receptor [Bacteroidales bacterium]|nr:helical backbone metal receptor [Bacteroidales bacterium]